MKLSMGIEIRGSGIGHEVERVSHMIFVDNCHLFAESKDQILKMTGDATENLKKRGFDWKEDKMGRISWGLCAKVGYLHVEGGWKKYVIKEVLKAMEDPITKEVDSTSAMKFPMKKADNKALWTCYLDGNAGIWISDDGLERD